MASHNAQEDTAADVFVSGALGVRAGEDVGIHIEAAPIWSIRAGLVFGSAAALFFRFDATTNSDTSVEGNAESLTADGFGVTPP